MLEYENQMMLDLLHEDGLLIAAKGLCIERILLALVSVYCDSGNLVLVIGANSRENEYFLSQLQGESLQPAPMLITSDCPMSKRSSVYQNGGILFITSQILVVDLLMDRIPAELITGIIVWKAHRILESCQESFILRLYRQKNKTGFIKALSSSPLSFIAGFCHIERIMRNLFVRKLYVWPRFHVIVKNCFDQCKPEVVELHLKVTSLMEQIQMAVLDLINATLHELRLSNQSVANDELNTENAVSKSFDKVIKVLLEPVWHQLSVRSRQLIADLNVLRSILRYLTQYDCVTFYNLVNSYKTAETAMQSAGWMILPAAETLFNNARERVFGNLKTNYFLSEDKECTEKDTVESRSLELQYDENQKWIALSEVLNEIKQETAESKEVERCLIVAHDDKTVKQIKEYLIDGTKKVLDRMFYRTIGARLGFPAPANLFSGTKADTRNIVSTSAFHGAKKTKSSTDERKVTHTTTTQHLKKCEAIEKYSVVIEDEELFSHNKFMQSPLVFLHHLKDSNSLMTKDMLEEIRPKYIIMYDAELQFIRQVEVWQASSAEFQCRVYFFIYKGTVEEQLYLTSLKKEKDAFEYLVKEKASMVFPEYTDGKTDDHPDFASLKEADGSSLQKNTRKVCEATEGDIKRQRVIVDMREFRSELPALIHKRGIDIIPATIEVGDYILTPDICVERKSLSDLIGSLQSGRLYNQVQGMTRCYKRPILLIEFDQNKPFYLQGHYMLSSGSSTASKDITAKLQLLTLHFPHLRLLWCASPYATAEIFQMLKDYREEPSLSEAKAVTDKPNMDAETSKFNSQIKDLLMKLPCISTRNIYQILHKVADLPSLLALSVEELSQILESGASGEVLHQALHGSINITEVSDDVPTPDRRTSIKFTKKRVKRFT